MLIKWPLKWSIYILQCHYSQILNDKYSPSCLLTLSPEAPGHTSFSRGKQTAAFVESFGSVVYIVTAFFSLIFCNVYAAFRSGKVMLQSINISIQCSEKVMLGKI